MLKCKKCNYFKQSCKGFLESNFTKGTGNENADVMVIVDSPFSPDVEADSIGNDSNFNETLKRYLEKVNVKFDDIYLTTLIKCYISDKKKKPTKVMKERCIQEYLNEEIKKVNPKVILLCGRLSIQWFIPEVTHRISLKQVIGNSFYNGDYDCNFIPIYDFYYLSNFTSNSIQIKQVEKAFSQIKVIQQKENTNTINKIKYSHDLNDLDKLGEFISNDTECTGLDPYRDKIITIALTDIKNKFTVSFDAEDYGAIIPCTHCNGTGLENNIIKVEAIEKAKTDKQKEKAEALPEMIDCTHCEGKKKILADNLESNIFYTKVLPSCVNAISSRKVVFHNATYDIKMLLGAGYDITDNLVSDTMFMQFLKNPLGARGLGFLVQLYYGIAYKEEIDRARIISMDMEDRRYYCAEDTYYTALIFIKLFQELKKQDSLVSNKIHTNTIKWLSLMEFRGVYIDIKKADEIRTFYENEKMDLGRKFKKRFKLEEDFNLNSSKQLCKLFYEDLDLPVLVRTATKNKDTGEYNPSTNEEAIRLLAEKRPALKTLVDYRTVKGHLEKLNGYLKAADENNRIHSRFNLFSEASSRMMCSKPALQSIPRKSRLKEIFVATPGYTYVYYDKAQVEFRVMLHLAKDEKGIDFINKGKDIHSYIASNFWKKSYEYYADKKTRTPEGEEQRNKIKTVVYGVMYGRTPYGIVKEHGGSEEEAEQIMNLFFNLFRKSYFYLKSIEKMVLQDKKLRTPFGTYRMFPDAELVLDEKKKEGLVREAKSFIIQSFAVELFYVGAWKVHSTIRRELIKQGIKLEDIINTAGYVFQQHDSGVIEVKDKYVDLVYGIVDRLARNPYDKLLVPLDIDLKVGKSWDTLK